MASPIFPGEAGTELDLLQFLVSTPKNSGLPSSLSTSAPAEGEMTELAGEPHLRHARWFASFPVAGVARLIAAAALLLLLLLLLR
jgi:hypothetical protein